MHVLAVYYRQDRYVIVLTCLSGQQDNRKKTGLICIETCLKSVTWTNE